MTRFVLGALAVAVAATQTPGAPDIAIVNARVFTGDTAQPWAEAVAIRGNRLSIVGSTVAVRKSVAASSRVIDAGGRLVIPGINDAHVHPGASPPTTSLEGPPAMQQDPTLDQVLQRIELAVAKAPTGGWIDGEVGAIVLDDPKATRETLDRVTRGHPLLLYGWSGHGVIANTAALRALGIRDDEPDPPGGRFARAADGKTLTGLAEEYAGYSLYRRLSQLTDKPARVLAMQQFAAEAASFGITSAQAMMTSLALDEALDALNGLVLPLRLRLIDFPLIAMTAWKPTTRKSPSPLVTVSGTKWIIDGTPVERLMLLKAPYTDRPASQGRANFSAGDLEQFLGRALEAGVQPMIHGVGDAAIASILDALESTGGNKWKALRPRIEHGDMLEVADFARAARMGVTIVQNPSHFMNPELFTARLGKARARRVALVKDTIAAGVPFALGSDGPLNPYLNMMFAALHPAGPSQALTVEQSLVAYTAGSAAAEFAERDKGMLKPGMLADLALLSQDILKVPAPELPKTVSVLTVANGTIVHDRLSK